MTIRAAIQIRGIKWLIGFVFWTLIGLSFAFQFHLSSSKAGLNVTWPQAVNYALGDWYVFALLSVPVIRLTRFFHFEAATRGRSLAVHLLGSAIFSFAYMVLRAWVGTWQSEATFTEAFQPLLVKTWHFNFLLYWVMVAVTCAFDYYSKYRERELRAIELEKRLAQAKLQALQMQLNPHFLFNSLHSISALMHQDVEAADRMMSRLSELLRGALDNTENQEVPLRKELDFLKRYLEIEQIRFGSRLTIEIQAPTETLEAQVPNLILQPLVENAIRHGIEPHAGPGRIQLLARRQRDELTIEVQDTGSGLASLSLVDGVGLSNTRARLQNLYGDAHLFEFCNPQEGGLLVRMTIPFHSNSDRHEDSNVGGR